MFRKRLLPIFAIVAIAIVASLFPAAYAQDFDGRVLSVQTGDTFVVSVYGRAWRVKVDGVTATAPGTTPRAARAALANLVSGRTVNVSQTATENDGRIRAKVTANGADVTSALLSGGTVVAGNIVSPLPEPRTMKASRNTKGKGGKTEVVSDRQGSGNIKTEEVRNYLNKVQEVRVKNY